MIDWRVGLVGGPFDGDEGRTTWPTCPRLLYVESCGECRDTHWYVDHDEGLAEYALASVDAVTHVAKYLFGEIDVTPKHLVEPATV